MNMLNISMSQIQVPHQVYIAKKGDIPVASKLGFLSLRHQYNGKQTTAIQVAAVFSAAEGVAQAGFGVPFVDDARLLPTEEFFARARAAIDVLPQGKPADALGSALDDLHAHCGVG